MSYRTVSATALSLVLLGGLGLGVKQLGGGWVDLAAVVAGGLGLLATAHAVHTRGQEILAAPMFAAGIAGVASPLFYQVGGDGGRELWPTGPWAWFLAAASWAGYFATRRDAVFAFDAGLFRKAVVAVPVFVLVLFASKVSAAEPNVKLAVARDKVSNKVEEVTVGIGKFRAFYMTEDMGNVTWDLSPLNVAVKSCVWAEVPAGTAVVGHKEGDAEPAVHEFKDAKSSVLVVYGKAPGELAVVAWGVKDGRAVKSRAAILTVAGQGPRPPPPDPKPQPDPGPPPTPKAQKIEMIVIEETNDATADRGKWFLNAALAARIKEKGHTRTVVDKDVVGKDKRNPPADLEPYLKAARGKALPYLFLMPQTGGSPLYQGPLPETPEALVDLLKRIGG